MRTHGIVLTLLAFALLLPASVQAREEVGSWTTGSVLRTTAKQKYELDGRQMPRPDRGGFSADITFNATDPKAGTFTAYLDVNKRRPSGSTPTPSELLKVSGTYTKKGDKILLSPNRASKKRIREHLEILFRFLFVGGLEDPKIEKMHIRKLMAKLVDGWQGERLKLVGRVEMGGEDQGDEFDASWKFEATGPMVSNVE